MASRYSLSFYLRAIFLVALFLCGHSGVAKPLDNNAPGGWGHGVGFESQQLPLGGQAPIYPLLDYSFPDDEPQKPLPGKPDPVGGTLKRMLEAIHVMQSEYFKIFLGKWPSANDWTAAVMATQVSATISTISSNLGSILRSSSEHEVAAGGHDEHTSQPRDVLAFENLINHYFDHTAAFWYREDFFGIRFQAYDDMLWVVLEWLENIKFQNLHSELHYSSNANDTDIFPRVWHGTQFRVPTAHRSNVFYDLASRGWDTSLCDGGMIWSPWLTPYKNAITNELFVSASVGMYLYFPGDIIDDPMLRVANDEWVSIPHNPAHLTAAIKAYKWLKNSQMTGTNSLYADGFHIRGWSEEDPGSRECDILNTMVYTYNQGVILSGLRGLWLATGSTGYLNDGHDLISNVIKSTGWPNTGSSRWRGLGRGGVLEEACDSSGTCSQDGQTFKGIFFLHFAEFCRPLRPQEERMIRKLEPDGVDGAETQKEDFRLHQEKCSSYWSWIEHNAKAAYMTMNGQGKFGMWWGRKYPDLVQIPWETSELPHGAVDHLNPNGSNEGWRFFERRKKGASSQNEEYTGPRIVQSQSSGEPDAPHLDVNDRGRGRTVETQAGGLAVLRALYQWEQSYSQFSEEDEE
ncbi:hypothetical protein LOZ53_004046 [Ophidiomyces ophidiicola]|nr:hypothetical protein LOZ55_004606 [Ophidiomyces ophidiicola]KAI1988217.1 hypothetical protein LOZ53_004046 [Ophidiomyces ophidiicola]KAI1988726.1 hypothetical protein LOZ54_003132 [Ophidiomyces ophidiicola]KAI1999121.1 hypothetical protein LOZ51_001607 [Ophidiomyces ophidiicola]